MSSLRGLTSIVKRRRVSATEQAALETVVTAFSPSASPPSGTPPAAPAPLAVRHGAVVIPLPRLHRGAPFIVCDAASGSDSTKPRMYDIYIYGIIECPSMAAAAAFADVVQLLDTAKATDTFRFHICTGGGGVHEASQVISAMKSTLANVITIAEGPVCSAAMLIWLYGKERRVEDAAYFMQHMSSHGDVGNSSGILAVSSALVRYICDKSLDPMLAQGLLTQQEYSDIVDVRKDVWITADEMRDRLSAYESRMLKEGSPNVVSQ